ncbi:ParB/RepB/Spo0J family partition protein [Halomontanus rarus]|uniref:IbrB-like domain-containing protein n=1 Tax=Halomontanus rarus TaxID=3034020 RepID=UPI00307BACDD
MTDGIQATLEQALENADSDETDAEGELTEELLLEAVDQFFDEADDVDEQVSMLNALRRKLHDRSPFQEPVENIQWVKQDAVEGNDYNPNEVATPEMDLLHKSIKADGYTQPVVTYEIDDGDYEVVDGFHRTLIGKTRDDIRERLHDHIPVTVIDKPRDERMGSTIRHNRARGTHQIRDMSDLVVELVEQGWDDERICEELGMELDEVLKFKQVSGLKQAFGDHEFSQSWTEYEEKHGEDDAE